MTTAISSFFKSNIHYITDKQENLADIVAEKMFLLGSYLNDPFCNAYGFYRELQARYQLQSQDPTQSLSSLKALSLFLSIILQGPIGLLGIPLAFCVKKLATYLQPKLFLHSKGCDPKDPTDELIIRAHNVCGTDNGHVVTDAGVMPWPYRITSWIEKIKNENLVCYFEVFDIKAAVKMYQELKDRFANFYYNIGPTALGVSSGIFVAIDQDVQDAYFIPFPKDMLVGRTKHAEKGFFVLETEYFITYITHLQHSEEPERPTPEEKEARKKEIERILDDMTENALSKNKPILLMGDLNLDDAEYKELPLDKLFLNTNTSGIHTWGGDHFCSAIVKKEASSSRNLDYILLLTKHPTTHENLSILASLSETTVESDNFDSKTFKTEDVVSDHLALVSNIKLRKNKKHYSSDISSSESK